MLYLNRQVFVQPGFSAHAKLHHVSDKTAAIFSTSLNKTPVSLLSIFDVVEMNQGCIMTGGYCVQNNMLAVKEMGMYIVQRGQKNYLEAKAKGGKTRELHSIHH